MKQRILISILIIAIILSLIFALLPAVFPKIIDSHTWYKNLKCTACHKNIVTEIQSSNVTIMWPHKKTGNETQCRYCHIKGGVTGKGHNASYISCTKCHNATYFPAYNSTGSQSSIGGWEDIKRGIHSPFNASGKDNKTLNYGCMGCHTEINVSVKLVS